MKTHGYHIKKYFIVNFFDLRKLYRYLKFGVQYKFYKTLSCQKAYFYVYMSGKCTFNIEENETPLDGTIFTCQDKFSSFIIFHKNLVFFHKLFN